MATTLVIVLQSLMNENCIHFQRGEMMTNHKSLSLAEMGKSEVFQVTSQVKSQIALLSFNIPIINELKR